MITGAIKNKVDKIWTDIWAGGITNPITVIEQLTYLMFIRSLDEKELEREEFENLTGEHMDKIFPQSPAGQAMRWSKFKNRDPRDMFDIISQRVFPAIKNMRSGKLPDFQEDGTLVYTMEIDLEEPIAREEMTSYTLSVYLANQAMEVASNGVNLEPVGDRLSQDWTVEIQANNSDA